MEKERACLAGYVMILFKTFIYKQNDTNPLWPQFEHTSRLEKTILMPELVSHCVICWFCTHIYAQCLVLFAVYIRVHRKLLAGTKVLLGQNVFPLTSLKPGKKPQMDVSVYPIASCIGMYPEQEVGLFKIQDTFV